MGMTWEASNSKPFATVELEGTIEYMQCFKKWEFRPQHIKNEQIMCVDHMGVS